MIHVWNIYLHDWVIFRVNVGKCTIHGAFGNGCVLHICGLRTLGCNPVIVN